MQSITLNHEERYFTFLRRKLIPINLRSLADQMEYLFSREDVAVYLIPSGGVRDWDKHKDIFTHQPDGKPRSTHFIERILTFERYDPKTKRIGRVVSNPEKVRVEGVKNVVIYDDLVCGGYHMSEAAYFLLNNWEELDFSPYFTLYTAGKIDFVGICNFAVIKSYSKWQSLPSFLRKKAKKDKRLRHIYLELSNKNLMNKISQRTPFSFKKLVIETSFVPNHKEQNIQKITNSIEVRL